MTDVRAAVRRFWCRVGEFARPGRSEADLSREVASHLALLEDEFRRRGLDPEEARLAARRAFGSVDRAKEAHRDARSFLTLDQARRDLKLAVRSLARSPGFTAATVVILAVGSGANTAMFSVINGVLLKPLGYPEPRRIVAVQNHWIDSGERRPNMAGGDLMDVARLADGKTAFEAFAYFFAGDMPVQATGEAEMVQGARVHPDFFRVFGLPPLAGRLFHREDAQRSAIVSLGFAQRRFGGADAALGRSLRIGNDPHEIVGVMPPKMRFPADTDVWAAISAEPANRNRGGHNYLAVGRLAPGVSLAVANAELGALASRLATEFPDSNRWKTFVAEPLQDALVGRVRDTLLVLMGAVALVLLIACANAANLILARASGRSRELAVRAAVGAGRRHIVVQLLAESLVLALAAAALGLVVARLAVDALLRVGSRHVPMPRLEDVQLDGGVLVFTATVAVLTAIVSGLVPALQAARVDVSEGLGHGGGARGVLGAGSSRIRNGLVVAQITLSFMLAVNAGLLLRSFLALSAAPLGFRTDRVLVAYASAPARGSIFDKTGLEDFLRVGEQYEQLFARLEDIPGVTAAGGVMGLPTGTFNSNGSYAVEGQHQWGVGDPHRLPRAGFRLASPGYFRALGIPLLHGRDFDRNDRYDRPFVAIVSESLARQSFGDADPIGHRVKCGFDSNEWMTIVGVVGDVRQASPGADPGPELYMPLRQHPYSSTRVQVVVRSDVEPEALMGPVREAIRITSPDVAVKFTTLTRSVADSVAAPRFRMMLVSAFAGLALVLAVAGIYAVMSYGTSQRTSEFGLRLALGANARDVVRLVVTGATRLVAIGLALGLALAAATSRVITSMLFGVRPIDATSYGAVLALSLPMIVLAALLPAMRAARVDPMVALREP